MVFLLLLPTVVNDIVTINPTQITVADDAILEIRTSEGRYAMKNISGGNANVLFRNGGLLFNLTEFERVTMAELKTFRNARDSVTPEKEDPTLIGGRVPKQRDSERDTGARARASKGASESSDSSSSTEESGSSEED